MVKEHAYIDRRSIALHTMIAAKLQASPELLQIAIANMERWSQRSDYFQAGRSQIYLEEWRQILSKPLPQIIELLQSEDEHMCALRQCTPFAGVLTPQERWKVYASY